MKEMLDKFKKFSKNNRNYLLFFTILFIIGIIAGSFMAVLISETDKKLVFDSLEDFKLVLLENKINFFQTFLNTIGSNMLYVVTIWLLGISIIGIPIILFLFFKEAFVIGFAVASIFINYKLKGILFAFFYVFPHHLINILASFILLIYAIGFSFHLIEAILKKRTIDFKIMMRKYKAILLLSIIIFTFTAILESFLMPFLLKIILQLLK